MYHRHPLLTRFDCISLVTNNHDFWKQAIEMCVCGGAMVLDVFSAYRNYTEWKHCNTTTSAEGFTTMLSDLCGLLKPCGKDFEV